MSESKMAFPIKVCVVCGDEFELRPGKPGFANRCPSCSEPEEEESRSNFVDSAADSGLSEARRKAMRDMLYRGDS